MRLSRGQADGGFIPFFRRGEQCIFQNLYLYFAANAPCASPKKGERSCRAANHQRCPPQNRVRRTSTAPYTHASTSTIEQGSQYVSSAYLRSLEKMLPPPASKPKVPPLEARLAAWLQSLPEFTRNRPFSMREFELALGCQGRFISPVLLRLGWRRQRLWNSRGSYHRYWQQVEPSR